MEPSEWLTCPACGRPVVGATGGLEEFDSLEDAANAAPVLHAECVQAMIAARVAEGGRVHEYPDGLTGPLTD